MAWLIRSGRCEAISAKCLKWTYRARPSRSICANSMAKPSALMRWEVTPGGLKFATPPSPRSMLDPPWKVGCVRPSRSFRHTHDDGRQAQ